MAKIFLYQGDYREIKMPEIRNSKFHKDFGDGFYCTILNEQAIKWAKKFDTPVVNFYEYEENPKIKGKRI